MKQMFQGHKPSPLRMVALAILRGSETSFLFLMDVSRFKAAAARIRHLCMAAA